MTTYACSRQAKRSWTKVSKLLVQRDSLLHISPDEFCFAIIWSDFISASLFWECEWQYSQCATIWKYLKESLPYDAMMPYLWQVPLAMANIPD